MKDKSELLKIVETAYKLINEKHMSKSDAVVRAFDIDTLRNRMRQGVISFVFKKADGSLRAARGTLLQDIIIEHLVYSGRKVPEGLFTYFDTDKESWRSFKIENLIYID